MSDAVTQKDTVCSVSACQNGVAKKRLTRNGEAASNKVSYSELLQSSDKEDGDKAREDSTLIMKHRRKNGRHTSSWCQGVNMLIVFSVIFIPTFFIYIGYFIGTLFMPPAPKLPAPGIVMDMSRLNYSWYNTHNLTISFSGGLGNQMFQYASLYGISKANGLKPVIGNQNIIARVFRMLKARRSDMDGARVPTGYGVYSERKSNAYDSRTFSLNFMKNIVLDGFFQSWRYFDHVRSDLRKQFAFRQSTLSVIDTFLHDSGNLAPGFVEITFVGIHVRRGDMLERSNMAAGYTVADKSYFLRAMRYFAKKFPRVVFVVTSDDLGWCTENLNSKQHENAALVFSRFSEMSPEFDLALLSRCNHTVITVGTFGWWGAWLAGGETIYYRDFPRSESTLRDNFRPGDYYMPRWIAM